MLSKYLFDALCLADSVATGLSATTQQSVNRLQQWLIMGGVFALLFLVIFQTVSESRRHRRQTDEEQKKAENEADRIRSNATQQAGQGTQQ